MKTLEFSVFALFVFLGIGIANSQTYYYKLNSYGKNGTENTKVSGGQFITFQAAICMETKKDGTSIGTGYLMRKNNAPNVYVGSANWGAGTKFEFSSDKSTLKVYAPNGLIYRYARCTPPSNATTCSLTRRQSSADVGGGYVYSGSTGTTSSSSSSSTPAQSRVCSLCGGTGLKITEHYSAGQKKYCETCGKTVFTGHMHVWCDMCKGTGRLNY